LRLPTGFRSAAVSRSPRARRWSNSRIDTFAIDAFTRLAPGGDANSVARLGARLSWTSKFGKSLIAEPYAGANWVKNLSNDESATILSADAAGTVIGYGLSAVGFRETGQYVAGLNLRDERGHLSGFVEGRLDRGSGVKGETVSAGVRVNF
jgi:outer membrane autotransporter protein